MRRNNFNFNPRVYNEHLSPLGRKVLNELIKIRNKESYQARNQCYESQRMPSRGPYLPPKTHELVFCSEKPSIQITNMSSRKEEEKASFDFEHVHYNDPYPIRFDFTHLTKTAKLQTPVTPADKDVKIVNGGDLIKSVMKAPETYREPASNHIESRDSLLFIPKTASTLVDNVLESEEAFREPEPIIEAGPSHNIDWDNMFDTELINEIDIPSIEDVDNQILNERVFQANLNKTKNEVKPKNKKPAKRNNQLTNSNPAKKVKRSEVVKIEKSKVLLNRRKEKYTTTVKNWLDDVDRMQTEGENVKEPSDMICDDYDKESTTSNKKEIVENKTERLVQKPEPKRNEYSMTIEKVPKTKISKKKEVQSKLANKDGVMKFSKPKLNGKANKENTDDAVENKVQTESKPSVSETTIVKSKSINSKPKKTKPGFVVPIKSQLPVKDVLYAVCTVDETNAGDFDRTVDEEQKDVTMVLVYRNGFCQLNEHHTDDSCVPEGLMLHLNYKFFYLKKGNEQLYSHILTKILKSKNIICYEGKQIMIYLKTLMNLELYEVSAEIIIDLKIGGSILDPDNPPSSFSELQKLLSFSPLYTIATECILQKTCWYSSLLDECAVKMSVALKEESLWSVFREIEMPLLPIIADMEYRGVRVDEDALKSMEAVLLVKMKAVEQECYKAAGKTFQINSPLQVRNIIYEELHLDEKCNLKIRETITQGAKSTSEAMLRSLMSVHDLPRLVLEYRHLHKAHSTFLAGIASHVTHGRIKPTWVQTAAATGRISSANPNLQAIPKALFNLVRFPQPDTIMEPGLSFRSVYVADPGHTLLAADFKQIECRLFAHAAGDARLSAAIAAQDDIFRALAAQWYKKPESEISSEDRERTKRIIYASLYGAGTTKLMDILDVSYERALAVSASFNRTFPSLRGFCRSVVERCRSEGAVRTAGARRRVLRLTDDADPASRAHVERQAINFVIQGSAADICKVAMRSAVDATLRLRARVLLQIHDELLWHVHRDDLHQAAAAIGVAMESCGARCGVATPLPVALACGDSWAGMEPYRPPGDSSNTD